MKILAIIGSPRKGNSYTVTREIEKSMKELGDVDFQYVFLGDVRLETCRGCLSCLARGVEFCPLKDDREDIEKKMSASDGLILVSPVYVMNVTGLMKNFIDRICHICHRPRFFDKYAMIVCTTGAIGLKEALMYLRQIAQVWGFRKVVTVGARTPSYQNATRNISDRISADIRRKSKEFYEMIAKKKYSSPSLGSILQFRIQRAVFAGKNADWKNWPKDAEFYSKLLDKRFYVDTRLNPLKDLIARVMETITVFRL